MNLIISNQKKKKPPRKNKLKSDYKKYILCASGSEILSPKKTFPKQP